MEAVAKYDFNATAEDELSFRKGDILKILGTTDSWYKAEMHGLEGFVPMNYIENRFPSWFQEGATRQSAEETLMSRELGSFLIRGSQSSPGDFSISVRHETDVQHFKVMKDNKGNYFLWSEKFSSLNKLVEFYKTASITKNRHICLREDGQQERSSGKSPDSASGPRRPSETNQQTQKGVMQVRALYDFKAEEEDELGFNAGDVIEVINSSDPAWWKGKLRGNVGLFPTNYVKTL